MPSQACYASVPQVSSSIKWNCPPAWQSYCHGEPPVISTGQALGELQGQHLPLSPFGLSSSKATTTTTPPHRPTTTTTFGLCCYSCLGVLGSQEVFWRVGGKTSQKVPGPSPLEWLGQTLAQAAGPNSPGMREVSWPAILHLDWTRRLSRNSGAV